MSLMFAALKRMESPSGGSNAPAPAPAPAGRARRWLWPALAVTGSALLAGGWLWASARPTGAQAGGSEAATIRSVASVAPAAAVTPAQAPTPIAAASTADAQPARATPAIVADTAGSTSPPPQKRSQEPATAVTPVSAPTPTPTPTPKPAPAPAPAPATAPEPAPTPAPAALVARIAEAGATDIARAGSAEARPVADLVAAIGHAIHAGDTPAAQARLAELEAQLPPRSLTLLRMQAWVAHESGDTATAMAAYRQVVARLPGDQTAVINLAILEAGNGQPESARERLRRLRAMDPGSHAVERAIGRVESMLR